MWLRLLLVLCIMGFFSGSAAALEETIWLLHSDPIPSAWTRDIAAGLTAGLHSGVEVRQVFLQPRSLDEDAFDEVFERLSGELAGTVPQAVVTSGETAFAFARKYGEDLFPDAPVIFCSMARPDPHVLMQCSNCTGITMAYAPKAAVDLIFSLRPKTRLVVVIADGTPTTKPLMEAVQSAMQPYMDRAQIMFPGFEPGDDNGLDTKGLGETLSSVPTSGVVLFLGFAEDRAGKRVSDEEISALFREHAISPIFVLRDAWPNSGVVGGWMLSGQTIGRDTARLVERILQGEVAQEMLPESTRPELRLDGTALTRFNLKPPSGAVVFNPVTQGVTEESVLPVTGLAWFLGLSVFVVLLYGLHRYRP